MVSFHQKIMAIVDDLINHKFGTSSYPVRAYNRTVIVPYSLKDIQSCLVARYDKTKEGKLYAPSQIRKATQCFDELVDRSLATVKNPRSVPSKKNHALRHEYYNPDKPALLYLNLVKILVYLESEGTEGTEVESLRSIIDKAKNANDVNENELTRVYLERLNESVLDSVDFIGVVRLIKRFEPSTVKSYLPVLMRFLLSSGIDRKTLIDSIMAVEVDDSINGSNVPEPVKEVPEPVPDSEDLSAQNVPIEPFKDPEHVKTCSDTETQRVIEEMKREMDRVLAKPCTDTVKTPSEVIRQPVKRVPVPEPKYWYHPRDVVFINNLKPRPSDESDGTYSKIGELYNGRRVIAVFPSDRIDRKSDTYGMIELYESDNGKRGNLLWKEEN